ncbi:anti-sigma factor [Sediminitomix flava]|uniref:Anti-sigma-K factor rskA n=1 Tax=Sediminitomix flava TaxID=379075 RepID=A0A315Z0Y5_SEDFL|nr:anti-sigma factor [Sediminitomix flava]PWJ36171.1 anti-sigma-K factor rskA [Sediminitomix flava]
MKQNFYLSILLVGTFFFASCDDDDDNNGSSTSNLTLNISGLEDLGDDYAYEGWIIVDGAPISAGIFNVDSSGNLSETSFELDTDDLNAATAYVLTIEPNPDSDSSPSDVHILAGDFSNNLASLTVDHPDAIGSDFTSAVGEYILATPTDDDDTNETSGIWCLNPNGGDPIAGLTLPTLPAGWTYEGWAVIDGNPITTGTFTNPDSADSGNPFSGTVNPAPNYPGEDFLQNAPDGVTFPADLLGRTVVISVEPVPDNSPAPFLLKPLAHEVPSDATSGSVLNMDNNAEETNPTGTASR